MNEIFLGGLLQVYFLVFSVFHVTFFHFFWFPICEYIYTYLLPLFVLI